jgi:hypothetical protein
MSLISEALRKARQETTGRDAERRGLKVPPGWDRPISGSRLGAGLVLGAVIALAAALAGATVVWWAVGRGDDGESVATISGVEPVAEALREGVSDETRIEAGDDPATLRSRAETEMAPRTEDITDIRAGDPPAQEPQTDPVSPIGDTEAAGAAAVIDDAVGQDQVVSDSPPSGEVAGAPAGTRIFVVDADLGQTKLTLDFIAYRPDDPFAEINGREVHVGSRIEGLTVEEIARDFVRLADERGEVILRVR